MLHQRAGFEISDPSVGALVRDWLGQAGFRIESCSSGPIPAGLDVLIVDCPGTGGSGLNRVLGIVSDPDRPALLALCDARDTGVAVLRAGADDCLVKPLVREEFDIKLGRVLEFRRMCRDLAILGAPARTGAPLPDFGVISGKSEAMRRVREQIRRVAPGRATVLITGETGTGKELVATAIHRASPRRGQPNVKVNCAALPDPLLESELFGHERGAFTGAEQRRIGRFEEAHGGTIFLDEIGDMHLRTQAKVLRALQEQEFERVGGVRPIRVDVRIIAATNQDLRGAIERGTFREDLFFRLDVVSIHVPALRDHPQDIPLLAGDFLAHFNAGAHQGKSGISPDAMDQLLKYPWPGNVRELRNTIERAVLMGESDHVELADLALPEPGEAAEPPARARRPQRPDPMLRLPEGGIDIRDAERELILQALERSGWIQKDAAGLLRMSRRKLNYRIQRLGITHPSWRRNR